MPSLREVLQTAAYPTVDIPARFRQEGRTERQLKSQLQTQKLNRDITEESRRRKKQFLTPMEQYLEELAQSLRSGQQAPIAPPGQQEGGQGQPLTEEMLAETVMGKRPAQPSQGQHAPSLADLLAQQEAQATGVQPDAAQMAPKPTAPAQPQQPRTPPQEPGEKAQMPMGGAFDQQAVLDLALATDQISPDQYNAATQKLRESMEPTPQGDFLGKASGFMNQYLHAARLGQLSADPKDPDYISFDDWLENTYGIRARGKLKEEEEFEPRIAGKKKQAEQDVRAATEPQIREDIERSKVKGAGKITPIQKRQQGIEKLASLARESFNVLNILREEGGIGDLDATVPERAAARFKSSPVGQFFQRGMSKEQSTRDWFKSLVTQMLNSMKSVEGLGATQMNTAREMQLFLDALPDLKDYQSAVDRFTGLIGRMMTPNPADPIQYKLREKFVGKRPSELTDISFDKLFERIDTRDPDRQPKPQQQPQGGAPKEGQTKTNAAGYKVIYKGGKWQLAE